MPCISCVTPITVMKHGSCLTEHSYRWVQEIKVILGQTGTLLHLWNNTVVILDWDKFKHESLQTTAWKVAKQTVSKWNTIIHVRKCSVCLFLKALIMFSYICLWEMSHQTSWVPYTGNWRLTGTCSEIISVLQHKKYWMIFKWQGVWNPEFLTNWHTMLKFREGNPKQNYLSMENTHYCHRILCILQKVHMVSKQQLDKFMERKSNKCYSILE